MKVVLIKDRQPGFLCFWMGGSTALGLIGLFVTRLGVASLYPLILSLAIGPAQDHTVKAGAWAILASGVAVLTLPLVLGHLSDGFGIRPAYAVVALLQIGVFLIIFITQRRHLLALPVAPK